MKQSFWTPLNGYIWSGERGKIYKSYFQGRKKQVLCMFYKKYIIWNVFKNSIKLLVSSFLVILQTFFTQGALEEKSGYSKATQRPLRGHLGCRDTQGTLFGRVVLSVLFCLDLEQKCHASGQYVKWKYTQVLIIISFSFLPI